jgi:hypothetical protein
MDIRDVADAVQTGVGNTLVMLIGALVLYFVKRFNME